MMSGDKMASQLVLRNQRDCIRILAAIITGANHPMGSMVRATRESTERLVYDSPNAGSST